MTEIKVLTAEEQVANVLAADARRVRRLTWATVGLWVVTAVMIVLLIAIFQVMYQFAAHTDSYYRSQREKEPVAWKDRTPEQIAIARAVMMNAQVTWAALLVTVAVALLSLSVLGNMLLVHVNRRATLRQIQTSLAAIASQLSEIQRQRGSVPPTTGG
jgi:hypothetical protein